MALLSRSQYQERLQNVRLLVTDVDGVLTDGSIYYTEQNVETKQFHVRDGSGFYIARLIDLPLVVITARSSAAVARRFSELPVHALVQGTFDKVTACADVQRQLGIDDRQVAYMGDDLVDLPLLRRVGVAITVADAHPLVRQQADWITGLAGGKGALREVVDDIVSARGLWDRVMNDYETRQGGASDVGFGREAD